MLLHKIVATVAGAGYSPFAPGTMGSIVAFALYVLMYQTGFDPDSYYLILVLSSLIGFISTHYVEQIWEHDSSKVVVDEFIGFWITLLFVPYSFLNAVLALVLFRIFDIWKPLGIRTIDTKLGGAAGVILDDVLAGVYACLSLHLLIRYVLPLF